MDEVELTAEQEAEARQIEDVLLAKAQVEVRRVARLLASKTNSELLGETEFQVREAVHRLGGDAIDAALSERKKKGYQGPRKVCPHCGKEAPFHGYRGCTVTTIFGPVVYERAYYRCGDCQRGDFPTDAQFRVEQHLSPGAREMLALVGVLEPFAQGADQVLPRLTGLIMSPATVLRTTEAVGQDVARQRLAGKTFGSGQRWDWHRDTLGNRVAYVSLDATGVAQQGPHAEKAEGRMPWVAAVFNPHPTQACRRDRQLWQRRYVAGLVDLPAIGQQLRAECQAVGVDQAEVTLGLTDGGAGLEECLLDVLGGVARQLVFILDFWHAAEHVVEFSQIWFPPADPARKPQVEAWCHTLKHQGGAVLVSQLRTLDLASATPAAQEAHRQLLGYLERNLHRTDYPTYLANGWQIGSGVIESACKTVIGTRLKGPGMRWRPPGTNALVHLRALYRSDPTTWQTYWNRPLPA